MCDTPTPGVFWQKSPQSDENKGRGLQNCAKSSQLIENRGHASSRSKPKRKRLGNSPIGATKAVVRPTAVGFWRAKFIKGVGAPCYRLLAKGSGQLLALLRSTHDFFHGVSRGF